MKAIDKAYLDSLDDEMFIAHMLILYGVDEPIWELCSQEEYEKYNGSADSEKLTVEKLMQFTENILDGKIYRAVPVYHNGGGILDQILIPGKRPDSYIYEKLTGHRKVLLLGSELMDYCKTRECMKPFF